MKVKFPKTVRVLSRTYEIGHKNKHQKDSRALAYVHLREQYIFINQSMTKEEQLSSLLHEVLHIIHSITGFDHISGPKDEESLVRLFEPGLFSFMQDNPKILRMFLNG